MKTYTPEEEVIRAGQAKDVLRSNIFLEAKQSIHDGIDAQMLSVATADTNMHTKLIIAKQLWAAIETYLDQLVTSGQMAQFKINEDEKREEQRKRFAIFGR
jgi:hypothetical protein